MIITNNYLERLGQHQLSELAEFIVSENFKYHADDQKPESYRDDIKSIYNEEVKYFTNSKIYVAKDYIGSILGSIRVLQWNYTDLLPLQKIFGINPLLALQNFEFNNIYHIGRFAIKKDVRDIKLLKQLMMYAIAPICEHKGNVAFAECDSKLFRTLAIMGIKAIKIGESVKYLGSETIPIAMPYEGLIDFYNKNKVLMSEDTLVEATVSNTHKNVVNDYYQHYYSFV